MISRGMFLIMLLFPPIFLPFLIRPLFPPVYPTWEYLSIDTSFYDEWIDLVREKGREGWELVEVEGKVFIFIRSVPYSSKWDYLASGPSDNPFPYPGIPEFLADYGSKGWELAAIHDGAYIFKRVQLVEPPPGH